MLMSPQNLPAVLRAVRERVARAAAAAGRSAESVTLLAVGKAQPLELLAAAADCGVGDFGESYLQEALQKIAALQERALTWHFIGRVQANKTRPIAQHFAWVHAVDRQGGRAPRGAAAVSRLPRLALRGLMCIPPEETEPVRQRAWFAKLRALRDDLNAAGSRLDTLSMGMSADFEAAIAE